MPQKNLLGSAGSIPGGRNSKDTLKLVLDELGCRHLKWILAPDQPCPTCEEEKRKAKGDWQK